MSTNLIQNIAQENIQKAMETVLDSGTQPIVAIRKEAYEKFLQKGLPNKKNENYKYTSIEQHYTGKYQFYPYLKSENINIDEVFKCDVPTLNTQVIVLMNGWYYATVQQPKLIKHSNGIIVGSLNEAINQYPELVFSYLGKAAHKYHDELSTINEALMQDGIFIYIPAKAQLEKPIQLINIVVADEPIQVYPRHLIISESEFENQILVCDHSLNPSPFIMNGLMEVFLKEKAKLSFYRMQNAHNHSVQITNNYIEQEKESQFHTAFITLHGGTVRNNLWVDLIGSEAQSNLNGLWLADKNQHIDYHTFVKHHTTNCESNQLFKGILDDEATGIFSGKILVEKGAQKTNAYQSNKNLIINPSAKVRSKPQLEIYADDVKCSHGSATGKLDDEAMFYLRSRGIAHKEACQLLMVAFASEITKQILIDALKEEVETLVDKRLRGELSRCNRCSIACS
ncbi:MAG: Fe-S cluster assembly protein SufD [Bacteroidales bacterium]|nr:Fe-S cluster assembly protein SufD [Bacteroidales bacterium]